MTRTSISLTAPSLGDGKELVCMDSHLSWSMPWVNEYGPDVHVYIRCNVTRFYMTNVGEVGGRTEHVIFPLQISLTSSLLIQGHLNKSI